jgi:hypothetical protein
MKAQAYVLHDFMASAMQMHANIDQGQIQNFGDLLSR